MSTNVTSPEFVDYKQALAETGLTKPILKRRIRARGITPYIDPQDSRRRLIAAQDLVKLVEVRPAPRREPTAA